MTGKPWSADGAVLDRVKGHLFDMEDHITRVEEGALALTGFGEMTEPHAYRAAINCIADVLTKEIEGIHEQFRLAWADVESRDNPSLKTVEE